MTSPQESTDVEHCPECGDPIVPESETCAKCGKVLFGCGPEESYGGHFRQGEDIPIWDPIESLDEAGDLHQPKVPDFEDLEAVFQGTWSEVIAQRAALGARGYETYLRDDHTKVIDPFITGGYAFGATLDAPKEDAAEIRKIIAEVTDPDEAPEKTPEERQIERVDKLGQNVILSAILVLTAPIGVVQAVRYARESTRLEEHRPDRLWVEVCTLLCLVEIVMIAWVGFLLAQ